MRIKNFMKFLFILIVAVLIFCGCSAYQGYHFEVGEPKGIYEYNCVDATLDMIGQCEARGYEYQIMWGNLSVENETFFECDHCWLLVKHSDDHWYAYDWGKFCLDEQHYEGIMVSKYELLETQKDQKAWLNESRLQGGETDS